MLPVDEIPETWLTSSVNCIGLTAPGVLGSIANCAVGALDTRPKLSKSIVPVPMALDGPLWTAPAEQA